MNQVATIEAPRRSVTLDMADRYGMEPEPFEATVRATCMSGQTVTREQFAAFLLVAKEYELNPLLKEIYAFPSRNGIQPIVSIDGWMNLINSHPQCDGLVFEDHLAEDGNLTAVTARIYRKDRSHPTEVTEYMAECQRNTEPWKKWPRRMLRHKAAIQCARYAFGFAGIADPDEGERMEDATDITPPPAPVPPPAPQIEPSVDVIEDAEVVDAAAEPAGVDDAPAKDVASTDAPAEPHDPETGEIATATPDQLLDDLESQLAGAQSSTDVYDIWGQFDGRFDFPPDLDKATKMVEAAKARIGEAAQ